MWVASLVLVPRFLCPVLVLLPHEPGELTLSQAIRPGPTLLSNATQPFARTTNDNCTQVSPNLVSRSAVPVSVLFLFLEIIISYFIAAMWHRQGTFS